MLGSEAGGAVVAESAAGRGHFFVTVFASEGVVAGDEVFADNF